MAPNMLDLRGASVSQQILFKRSRRTYVIYFLQRTSLHFWISIFESASTMRVPEVKGSANGPSSTSEASSPPKQEAETPSPARIRAIEFLRTLTVWDFIDPDIPWVLVENGSLGGSFDFVPDHFRVGPWSISALIYLTVLYYLTALAGAYFSSEMSHPWWSSDRTFESLEYPAVRSVQWYYNLLAGFWMIYVMKLIYKGPASLMAWGTYTVQSWTLLCFRHLLCAAAPVSPTAAIVAEWIRFPVACSATVTFVLFNFMVGPFVYFGVLKTLEQKRGFFKFITNFRLIQIHVFNMVFCWANVYWASPRRLLESIDLYLAVLSVMIYMTFYLGVLDRIGVHLYPVFSPRAGIVVVATWTIALVAYFTSFMVWRDLLQPVEDTPASTPALDSVPESAPWRRDRRDW
jgi:hypothetical protein